MKKILFITLLLLLSCLTLFSLELHISSTGGSLQAAVDQIQNNPVANGEGTIIIDQSVTTDVTTIPAGIALQFIKGNILSGSLTINGPIKAGIYQIFSGDVYGTPQVEYVVPQWWGAKGDGTSDDTNALEDAFRFNTFLPKGEYLFTRSISFSGKKLSGLSSDSVLKSSGYTCILLGNKHNVTLENFRYEAPSNPGFQVYYNSSNITFKNIHFKYGDQRILLFESRNITVDSCTFEETGYGIIQQVGYASSHVLITNCITKNTLGDFVEANCAAGAVSRDWIITNNRYIGNYSTRGIETRFVGITGVEGVIITNNYVEKLKGDSIIHLEDVKGNTIISNNQFYNSDGKYGYLYIIHSDEDTIISNNYFVHDDPALPKMLAINLNCGNYSNKVLINNNHFKGKAGDIRHLDALGGGYNSNFTVSNNIFEYCESALFTGGSSGNVLVTGNKFISCAAPIQILADDAASGGSCNNWVVKNNQFIDTQNEYCIKVNVNTNATSASNGWLISGNRFDKSIALFGSWYSQATDHTVVNNVFNANAGIQLAWTTNFLQMNNRRIGEAGWMN